MCEVGGGLEYMHALLKVKYVCQVSCWFGFSFFLHKNNTSLFAIFNIWPYLNGMNFGLYLDIFDILLDKIIFSFVKCCLLSGATNIAIRLHQQTISSMPYILHEIQESVSFYPFSIFASSLLITCPFFHLYFYLELLGAWMNLREAVNKWNTVLRELQ